MSKVETPFVIAVIREKEKSLLGENEITRIIHASSVPEAREVLMSTPYAPYFHEHASVSQALTAALEAEFLWLADDVEKEEVVEFIAARYDALHVAMGIIALQSGEQYMPQVPKLGTIPHEILHEMIFTNTPSNMQQYRFWYDYIQSQKSQIANGTWTTTQLFTSIQKALETRLHALAQTPFMHQLADALRERHANDEMHRAVILEQKNAASYELEWDEKVVALAKEHRLEPMGYDAIISYWIIKEFEVKNIRLMLAAIAGGFTKEEITALVRPLLHI